MDIKQVLDSWSSSDATFVIRAQDGFMVIEGSDTAIRSFGELLVSMSNEIRCGLSLSPTGVGSELFAEGSTMGVYVHQLPCNVEHPVP